MATVLALPNNKAAENADPAWLEASWLPCELSVEIPVAGFTVGDLLRLEGNSLVHSGTPSNADVSMRVNGALIGRAELEISGDRLAVRLTELA